ncbi:MAG: 3-phosphoshikimate 1-carboxyvinyltransferase [Bacteroidetes bacterium]|nr:3-phosphoshikimate 1-carboxyvinyltransferase [Bacteroidota bacterium]
MQYQLKKVGQPAKVHIQLPSSKSISNRMLIIDALANHSFNLRNVSESDDTRVMQEAFRNIGGTIDIGHAGTSMRFLTAWLTTTGKTTIITGSERMKNRPIAKLVDALRVLGANIEYMENQGYPPLKIGKSLPDNDKLTIDGSISSQYITALLLIAPYLSNGLTIEIANELVSRSYVEMTLGLMKQAGIAYTWNDNTIAIKPQQFIGGDFFVESDWSAASYWYQMAVFFPGVEFYLEGLQKESLQGDSALTEIFRPLGVHTEYTETGTRIIRRDTPIEHVKYNFINSPDLIQTLVVTCVFSNISFRFSGAQTLRIKETDRIAALQTELGKFGFHLMEPEPGVLQWHREKVDVANKAVTIDTYHDHRMAMAFAPVAVFCNDLRINDPMVVTKSYPNFWKDMQKAGIETFR